MDDASTIIPCGNGTVGERNLTDLDHGPRIFWVRGKDSAGNVGEFVPHRWLVGEYCLLRLLCVVFFMVNRVRFFMLIIIIFDCDKVDRPG